MCGGVCVCVATLRWRAFLSDHMQCLSVMWYKELSTMLHVLPIWSWSSVFYDILWCASCVCICLCIAQCLQNVRIWNMIFEGAALHTLVLTLQKHMGLKLYRVWYWSVLRSCTRRTPRVVANTNLATWPRPHGCVCCVNQMSTQPHTNTALCGTWQQNKVRLT